MLPPTYTVNALLEWHAFHLAGEQAVQEEWDIVNGCRKQERESGTMEPECPENLRGSSIDSGVQVEWHGLMCWFRDDPDH